MNQEKSYTNLNLGLLAPRIVRNKYLLFTLSGLLQFVIAPRTDQDSIAIIVYLYTYVCVYIHMYAYCMYL